MAFIALINGHKSIGESHAENPPSRIALKSRLEWECQVADHFCWGFRFQPRNGAPKHPWTNVQT